MQLELPCEINFWKHYIKPPQLFTFVQVTLEGRKMYNEYNKQMLYQVSIIQY
jgi:hypothetical protein